MTRLHPEVMSPGQADALRVLGPMASRYGFYLGGGTAVALLLGHRASFDLDWFAPAEPADPLALAAEFVAAGVALKVLDAHEGTLHAECSHTSLSFLRYRYPLLAEVIPWPEHGCSLASLDDLAAMKLAALAQRGRKRDFLDVYALVRAGFSIERALELFQAKYGLDDIGHVLRAMAYFDDAEQDATPRLLAPVKWEKVKEFFRGEVRRLGA